MLTTKHDSAHPSPPPTSLPSPLFHAIPSLPNFRDIGGYPILPPFPSPPQYVRTSLIYRGSDTTHITPADIQRLASLNITTDFDLRSASQISALGYKDLGAWGIQRIWSPVFVAKNEEGEKGKVLERYAMYASEDVNDIVAAFIEILTSGAVMMATVMRHLISSPDPLFMHCTTGNNRTGVFVALLLRLLCVPPEYVVREYTLSETGLAATRHVNVERLLRKGAFRESGKVEARRKCERMIGARAESMVALLQEVERRWGGAEGYFLDVVGLTKEELRRVREIMTMEGNQNRVRDIAVQS